jgi:SAM-dependent methyltransferase
MLGSDAAVHTLKVCPLCSSRDALAPHGSGAPAIVQCRRCGLVLRNPQPSDEALAAIYGPGYFFGAGDRAMEAATAALKSATADRYLDAIEAYRAAPPAGRLLDIGCGHGDLMARARVRGYDVQGTDVSADAVRRVEARLGSGTATRDQLGDLTVLPEPFDVCVLSDVIEHARDPESLLLRVRRMLAPDGTLFISTPSVAHWSARLLKRHWMEFKEEHLFYFDPETMRLLLHKCGYDRIVIAPSRKTLNLDYLGAHFRRFRVPPLMPAISLLQHLTPGPLRRRAFRVPTGGMTVIARPAPGTTPQVPHDTAAASAPVTS